MKYNTILFDADDTLLDFKTAEHKAISSVLSDLGLPSDENVISTYSAINDSLWKALERGEVTKDKLKIERFARLCAHFGFDVEPEGMAERYINELSLQSELLPCAEKVCSRLYESGVRMYIITNGIKYIQSKRFAATPIASFFKKVFISEEMGFEKPHPEFFKRATAMIEDFDPKTTIVIGDSLSSDIKGGINFGLDTCWYNPKEKTKPDGMNITYEIKELTNVFEIVGI